MIGPSFKTQFCTVAKYVIQLVHFRSEHTKTAYSSIEREMRSFERLHDLRNARLSLHRSVRRALVPDNQDFKDD